MTITLTTPQPHDVAYAFTRGSALLFTRTSETDSVEFPAEVRWSTRSSDDIEKTESCETLEGSLRSWLEIKETGRRMEITRRAKDCLIFHFNDAEKEEFQWVVTASGGLLLEKKNYKQLRFESGPDTPTPGMFSASRISTLSAGVPRTLFTKPTLQCDGEPIATYDPGAQQLVFQSSFITLRRQELDSPECFDDDLKFIEDKLQGYQVVGAMVALVEKLDDLNILERKYLDRRVVFAT
ncbi:hypothetical protein C8R46DRAFT_1226546 [Mycena filopes]|nr:hypothetical protein C8R46DRAFT_1226546 [Mycena filopes]